MDKETFVYRMLHERGVKVGTHYIPLHWTTAFRKRGYQPGQFPVADMAGERLVTLPIHPRQTEEAIAYLVESVHALRG
ncbi:MAG: TDP-4-oxo-6-deoxy-D-glucose transaminase [Candidatus Hydrogenedentes bacterium ADurb.Bin101]|nr:MAG: TDP-4-oxo-6-deoxy-D-glucose transaminase [Candidatus Hydrogenedentes bacterium ADurb.Bin101]